MFFYCCSAFPAVLRLFVRGIDWDAVFGSRPGPLSSPLPRAAFQNLKIVCAGDFFSDIPG